MGDILNRRDIEKLVNLFYKNVQSDDLLAPVFAHVDWTAHLPIMYNFWASLLLGERSYQGNPFQKHVALEIDATHFDRWLQVFITTVDENFSGEKATEIKDRATNIARLFQHKLGLLPG